MTDEKRTRYNEGKKKAIMKYLSTLRQVLIRVKPEEYEIWEKSAKEAGYTSMRRFIIDAVNEKIERIKPQ